MQLADIAGMIRQLRLVFPFVAACVTQEPSLETRFDDAMQQWKSHTGSYSFTRQERCFCDVESVRVEVAADRKTITSASYVSTGAPFQDLPGLRTLDDYLGEIRSGLSGSAYELDVVFDHQVGFPLAAYVDLSHIPDTEYQVTIWDYQEP